MRTMRDVWDERRKGAPPRPERPGIVRCLTPASPATRRRPPKGTVPPHTWVFSKGPERATDTPPERQLLVKRTRKPEVDLFDEDDELVVLADMPGASDEDVRIRVEKDLLIIEAVSTGAPVEVHYYTEALLPYEVREDFQRACKGGVLEVHLLPKRRAGGRARAQDDREDSVKEPRAGKRKVPRRPRNGSTEKQGKRKGRTGPPKGPKRES